MIGRSLEIPGWRRVDEPASFTGETECLLSLPVQNLELRVFLESDPYASADAGFTYLLEVSDPSEDLRATAAWEEPRILSELRVGWRESAAMVFCAASFGRSSSVFWVGEASEVLNVRLPERPDLPSDLLHFSAHVSEARLVMFTESSAHLIDLDTHMLLCQVTFLPDLTVAGVTAEGVELMAVGGAALPVLARWNRVAESP